MADYDVDNWLKRQAKQLANTSVFRRRGSQVARATRSYDRHPLELFCVIYTIQLCLIRFGEGNFHEYLENYLKLYLLNFKGILHVFDRTALTVI